MSGPLSNHYRIPRDEIKLALYGKLMYLTPHAKCQNGANCTGPGCRIYTGKTRRNGR